MNRIFHPLPNILSIINNHTERTDMKKADHSLARLFGVLVLPVFLAMPLIAGTTGKIAGTVKDTNTRTALMGVNVLVEGTSYGAITDENGDYSIIGLPPGIYSVRLTMMGYKRTVVEKIRVSIDFTTDLNANLQPVVLESDEGVTIVAEKPLVRKDMTSSLSSVGADEIADLPVSSVEDVLQLQAGVTRQGNDMHIRGGRSSEIAYWVDGVATTDVFNGSSGVTVENNSIQELQVLSGTFNAEYGQAMSGIVKIITKDGGSKLSGSINGYVGDYVSSNPVFSLLKSTGVTTNPVTGVLQHTGVLENPLKKFNPDYNLEFNLGGPVPFMGEKLTFFANGRFVSNEGYLYGRRWFTPYGTPGDSSFVPLSPYARQTIQGKLAYKLSNHITLKYNAFWNNWDQDRTYNQAYTYSPDGIPQQGGNGLTQIFELNHVLSQKTFYEFRINRFYNEYEQYLYKNPYAAPAYIVRVAEDATNGLPGFEFDPTTTEGQTTLAQIITDRRTYYYVPVESGPKGYVSSDSNSAPSSYSFNKAGNQINRYNRSTAYWVGKFDLTSQINRIHQLKFGIEARTHELTLDSYNLVAKTDAGGTTALVPYQPDVPSVSSIQRQIYNRKPREMSAYLQDKIELKDLIVNLGIRFDYFDANSVVMADPSDPSVFTPLKPEHLYVDPTAASPVEWTVEQRRRFMQEKSAATYALSPRFGLSFPITDRGAIHFSYGHFFQTPDFQYLYDNPDFKMSQSGGTYILGNANLKPQRTTQYEIGLQQQLSDDIGLDVSVFYRDVRDWVGTTPMIATYNPAVKYMQYTNKDYENVRGFTVKLEKRMTRNLAARVDYTYSKAEGTYTSPADAYTAYNSNQEQRLALIPMGFDQPHTLNAVLRYKLSDWMFSMIGNIWSGTPYTPTFRSGEAVGSGSYSGLQQNSQRKPIQRNVDLTIDRGVNVGGLRFNVFMNIYNVFDLHDVTNVYSDTQKADETSTRDPQMAGYDAKRIGTVEEWAKQPSWYTSPREIQLGLSVGF
jgi:outer membrane receptor protein involved in Fe transport